MNKGATLFVLMLVLVAGFASACLLDEVYVRGDVLSGKLLIDLDGKNADSKLAVRFFNDDVDVMSQENLSGLDASQFSDGVELDVEDFGFSVPSVSGNYSLQVFLDGSKVCEQDVKVILSGFIVGGVFPDVVPAAYPVDLRVAVSNLYSVSDYYYNWDFGDGASEEMTDGSASHTFGGVGEYEVKIEVVDKITKGVVDTSKVNVSVESPKAVIDFLFQEYHRRVGVIDDIAANFSKSERYILEGYVDTDFVKSDLSYLEDQYKQYLVNPGTSDEAYIRLMRSLLDLDVPYNVYPSVETNIGDFFMKADSVNFNDIAEFFNDYSYGGESDTANAIVSWFKDNLDVSVDYKVFSIYYSDRVENIFTKYDVTIVPKSDLGSCYFVVNNGKLILDLEDYKFNSRATGFSVDLSGEQTVSFLTEEEPEFYPNLYISPQLNKISVEGGSVNPPERKGFWVVILTVLVLVVVIGVLYMLLVRWYKFNYEKTLFKDKNDLFNLIYFIKNAKKKGLSEKQIRQRLKKSWKGEQVSYALNKEAGKPTGLWEPPFFWWGDKKEIEREMRKRKGKRVII